MGNELLLHVGMPKTASKSIELFLSENDDELRSQGWIYPDIVGDLKKDKSYGKHAMIKRNMSGMGVGVSYVNGRPFRALKSSGKIYKIIDRYLKDYNVIISEEGFWSPWGMSKIAEICKKFDQVKVVCYLRRQDLFIESLWGQLISEGLQCGSVMEFAYNPWVQKTYLDYFNRLRDLSCLVGKENLIVRVYEKAQLFNGNSIDDFLLDALKIHMEVKDSDQYRINERCTNSELYLYKMYIDIFEKVARHYPSVYKRFKSALGTPWFYVDGVEGEKGFPRLSALFENEVESSFIKDEERKKILDEYRDMNNSIAGVFLGKDSLFSDDVMQTSLFECRLSEEQIDEIKKIMYRVAERNIQVVANRSLLHIGKKAYDDAIASIHEYLPF